MTETLLKPEAVQEALGDLGTVEAVRWNRVKVTLKAEKVREAILRAESILACDHVVQISAADNGKSLELIYHLTGAHRMVVALAIEIPRDKAAMATVPALLPPARTAAIRSPSLAMVPLYEGPTPTLEVFWRSRTSVDDSWYRGVSSRAPYDTGV